MVDLRALGDSANEFDSSVIPIMEVPMRENLEGLVSGVSIEGALPLDSGEMRPLAMNEAGVVESPISRQSERKMELRLVASHSCGAIPKPKSPLLRMAEMRRSGLRGRALRQVSKTGSDALEMRGNKGKKGLGGEGHGSLSLSQRLLRWVLEVRKV